jgi:hypothetical protein
MSSVCTRSDVYAKINDQVEMCLTETIKLILLLLFINWRLAGLVV